MTFKCGQKLIRKGNAQFCTLIEHPINSLVFFREYSTKSHPVGYPEWGRLFRPTESKGWFLAENDWELYNPSFENE